MKYLLIAALSSSLLFSCGNSDTKVAGTGTYSKEDSAKRQQMLDAAADSANFTTIQWLDSMHQDLGKINEGAQVEVAWRFRNSGTKPLIISQANAGCGCTVAEKPEEPIAPGGEGRIKATFDSKGRAGTNNKDVTVIANTTGNTYHSLTFAVEAVKK
jgi:hypothetical protein